MGKSTRIILLVVFIIATFSSIGWAIDTSWSEMVKIGTIPHRPEPISTIQYKDNIIGVYQNQSRETINVFSKKNNSMDFDNWKSYSYHDRNITDLNIIKAGENVGIVYRSRTRTNNVTKIQIILYSLDGKLISKDILFESKNKIKDVSVYSTKNQLYVMWVGQPKNELQPIFINKFDIGSSKFKEIKLFKIEEYERVIQPRIMISRDNELLVGCKVGIRNRVKGFLFDYYFRLIRLNDKGQVIKKIDFGKSLDTILDERKYLEIDKGMELGYEPVHNRIAGVWTGSDSRKRFNLTGPPSLGVFTTIYDLDQNTVTTEDEAIMTLLSIGQFPDLKVDNKGDFLVTWVDDYWGQPQIIYGNLLELTQFNDKRMETDSIVSIEEAPIKVLSNSQNGAFYPRLVVDSDNNKHIFWWEAVEEGYKLIYRNNYKKVPNIRLKNLGLNPELDTFTATRGILNILYGLISTLFFSVGFTIVNISNIILVIGFFSFLKGRGLEETFQKKEYMLMLGLMIFIWILQSPINPIFININENGIAYFYGGAISLIFTIIFVRIKNIDLSDIQGKLTTLLIWSFWQHIIAIYPVILQWIS